jgi:nucleoside 2-deoxyribosyltransferase
LRGREEKETMPDPRLAIVRDKTDIEASDIILVNDTFPQASMIGTAMEVIYAFARGKIIIIFGCAHEHDYWLDYHCHARVETLEKACQLLKDFYI